MSIAVHPLPGRATKHEISRITKSIDRAPLYSGSVAAALKRTIRVIHGLPKLHTALPSTEIEIYIGKATRSASAVILRWSKHRVGKKKHLFGAILFRCSLNNAKTLEKAAIRVVKKLKDHGTLCVGEANISKGSGGKNPISQDALIYLTWGPMKKSSQYKKPGVKIIKSVAIKVASEMSGVVKPNQLERGLMSIKRPTKYLSLKLDQYRK